jgi:hypothetical protein
MMPKPLQRALIIFAIGWLGGVPVGWSFYRICNGSGAVADSSHYADWRRRELTKEIWYLTRHHKKFIN